MKHKLKLVRVVRFLSGIRLTQTHRKQTRSFNNLFIDRLCTRAYSYDTLASFPAPIAPCSRARRPVYSGNRREKNGQCVIVTVVLEWTVSVCCEDKLVDDSEVGSTDVTKAGDSVQLKHWKELPSHFDDNDQPFARGMAVV